MDAIIEEISIIGRGSLRTRVAKAVTKERARAVAVQSRGVGNVEDPILGTSGQSYDKTTKEVRVMGKNLELLSEKQLKRERRWAQWAAR